MNIEILPKEYVKLFNNYIDAKLYISFLNIDGKNDWRLPTISELAGLIDYLIEHDYPTNYLIATHADYWYYNRPTTIEYGNFKEKMFTLGVRNVNQ